MIAFSALATVWGREGRNLKGCGASSQENCSVPPTLVRSGARANNNQSTEPRAVCNRRCTQLHMDAWTCKKSAWQAGGMRSVAQGSMCKIQAIKWYRANAPLTLHALPRQLRPRRAGTLSCVEGRCSSYRQMPIDIRRKCSRYPKI